MEGSFKPSLLINLHAKQTSINSISNRCHQALLRICVLPRPVLKWPGSLPILLDFESPFELQVGLLVVVHELGDSVVFAPGQHAGRSGFRLDCVELASPCNKI